MTKYLLFFVLFINTFYLKAQQLQIDSTNLPIILINTKGQAIIDESKIDAEITILGNDTIGYSLVDNLTVYYNGAIGIEIRGRSSAELPQKPYAFETRNQDGESLDTSLFDLPSENDWILLANYNDKTFLRNTLVFQLMNKMGHYAPRTKHCEVFINDDYRGIYIFAEKIKRDENRVNIAKLNPDENEGDDLTGGYIFKNDYSNPGNSFTSSYSAIGRPAWFKATYVYEYPEIDNITALQKAYLKNHIYNFETALYGKDFTDSLKGYRAYLNIESYIDYFLINELSRNNDGFKKSRYYYKDKNSNGGLIMSGPVWDFDWAWKNIDECYIFAAQDGSGWAHDVNSCFPDKFSPEWIARLKQDSLFVNQLNKRYNELRTTLFSSEYLNNYIDSVAQLLITAQARHFQKWPILGINVGAPEVDEQPLTYEGEIEKIKKWIDLRLNWLDNNPLPIAELTPALSIKNTTLNNSSLQLFPNPVNDILFIESNIEISSIILYNSSGILLTKSQANTKETNIQMNKQWKGLIIVCVVYNDGRSNTAIISKN